MTKKKPVPQRLSLREITSGLKSLPGWYYLPKEKAITVECKMKDFMSVVSAIQKIAKIAEKANHHPDLHLTGYRNLKMTLSTHEAKGVTLKDLRLAKQTRIKGTR